MGLPRASSFGFVAKSGLRPYGPDPPSDALKILRRCSKRKQDEWRLACDEAIIDACRRRAKERARSEPPPPVGSRVVVRWEHEGDFDCLVAQDPNTSALYVANPFWDDTVPFDPDEDEWKPAALP